MLAARFSSGPGKFGTILRSGYHDLLFFGYLGFPWTFLTKELPWWFRCSELFVRFFLGSEGVMVFRVIFLLFFSHNKDQGTEDQGKRWTDQITECRSVLLEDSNTIPAFSFANIGMWNVSRFKLAQIWLTLAKGWLMLVRTATGGFHFTICCTENWHTQR